MNCDLKLIGYDLAESNLTLYWQLISSLTADYTTFVHIRNEANETVAQTDQPPLGGAYPTGLWDAEEIISDEIAISLPNNLPAGEYRVIVGIIILKPDNGSTYWIMWLMKLP